MNFGRESSMNPFVVEDVVANSAVSEFVNQARYSGGVAGLGQCVAPTRRGLSGLGVTQLQKATDGECPSGFHPGPTAASGGQYCIPDAAQVPQIVEVSEPKYSVSFKTPDGGAVKSSFDIWKPGKLMEETSGGGGGFFSSVMDAAGRLLTGAAPQQSYLPQVKESSPWPWVVGGIAVLGLGAFVLTRSKK